ncbi:RNA polymerase sigma-70 factor (ECF subfamily) [Gillisia sp. Hel_I_86]|uniref:RNA polymerase sigma factor n=1 Tax=Gillisia sp. Hel_I_86 TaxID=1249981 RepID=UPI00119BC3AD|nr:RNA polymerase sigma factor [Gillisia sp. Hel_I_86]TVZ27964.1 RNA polymerase sigma-70 factor (ECF subfamily) [Gillisia sp. Hel_I_86]
MNQHTFLRLIDPVKDKMFRLALRLLISKEAAEDATQEVILKIWNLKHKVKDYANLEAFMISVTKNYCLDQLKARSNNNLRIVHTNYENNEVSVHKLAELNDEIEQIERIVEMLPEQQKVIFQLRDIEEYDYSEIAEITKMKEPAIRVALSRARKKIKEELLKTHSYGIK